MEDMRKAERDLIISQAAESLRSFRKILHRELRRSYLNLVQICRLLREELLPGLQLLSDCMTVDCITRGFCTNLGVTIYLIRSDPNVSAVLQANSNTVRTVVIVTFDRSFVNVAICIRHILLASHNGQQRASFLFVTILRPTLRHLRIAHGTLCRASPSDLEDWLEDVSNKRWHNFLTHCVSSVIPRIREREEGVCSQSWVHCLDVQIKRGFAEDWMPKVASRWVKVSQDWLRCDEVRGWRKSRGIPENIQVFPFAAL